MDKLTSGFESVVDFFTTERLSAVDTIEASLNAVVLPLQAETVVVSDVTTAPVTQVPSFEYIPDSVPVAPTVSLDEYRQRVQDAHNFVATTADSVTPAAPIAPITAPEYSSQVQELRRQADTIALSAQDLKFTVEALNDQKAA